MMTDSLMWSPISLGRWAGTQVRINITFVFFFVLTLLGAAIAPDAGTFSRTLAWLGLLFLALAIHELGHAAMAAWLGTEQDDVRLWPLGNMVGPATVARSGDSVLVALAGPAFNFLAVLVTAIALSAAHAQFVWNPFGHAHDSGAPWIESTKAFAPAFSAIWWFGWFGYLNWVLFLANMLLPALPFDMGRVLRAYLANASLVPAKDSMIAPWAARSTAVVLALVGLVVMLRSGLGVGVLLILLALLIEVIVRSETRMMEDGGFFEDGVFGYDFSEGYTSLESSAAKVRPYRESALKRWRRRRSEYRRQRRLAREAAEDRRMDEILDKVHRSGRAALTDEEHRFLVRVSMKLRNRPKARD